MKFRVIWGVAASATVTDRMLKPGVEGGAPRVAAQIIGIDGDLNEDPLEVGESRESGVRVHTRDGLTVFFETFPEVQMVYVTRAVFFRPGARP